MPRAKTTFGTSDTPTKVPLDGYFIKGQWHCNCQPRLPAIQFQVKRDSKNKGRWFYACQIDRTKGKPGQPERCDFFLWAEDARKREEGAVLSNSRTEHTTPVKKLRQTTLSAAVTPRTEGPRPKTVVTQIAESERQVSTANGATARVNASDSKSVASSKTLDHDFGSDMDTDSEDELNGTQQTPSVGSKRKRPEDDEDDFGDLSSDEERQLAAITDSSSKSQESKRPGVLATPATQKTADVVGGMPTPSLTGKSVRRVLWADEVQPNGKKQRLDEAGSFANVGAISSATSSPSFSQEAVSMTPGSGATSSITEEVIDLLKGQKVDEPVLRQVRYALEKHAAKAKGLERGRDASRQAVKKADVKIAQLQQRIADLENQRKLDAEARKKIKSGLMNLYTDH
ncbi:hypothetical protein BJ170DRAFT_633328 [Xylariales sp. AK1849]|nr:hypothetical protein BJ170DRAFT_633328 [Xylariales sp. AK1849]